LKDTDTVVGLFQVRALQPGFDIAEWGFALGGEHWGTGLFMDAAELILDFVFDVVGVHPARGARGAHEELWTILADDRRIASAFPPDQLVH
jgi:Acetyltransferase (GNAT) domain